MNSLKLDNINISIATTEKKVSSVSLEVAASKVICLIGPNGVGKSSLAKGIIGFSGYLLSSGSIFLNGEDITSCSITEKARKGLFFVPQHTPTIEGVKLISLIHGAYISIFGTETGKSILDLKKEGVMLANKYGLKAELLDREVGSGLSGGEKKQGELLQLLLLKPKYVILDEIDSGVDVDTIQIFARVIEDLSKEQIGFIIISHNIHFLELIQLDSVFLFKDNLIVQKDIDVLRDIKKNGF
jgi:Fe-S cluster assembly ATP-binding protein